MNWGGLQAVWPVTYFGARLDGGGSGAIPDPDRELVVAALAEYRHGTRWFAELVSIHWNLVWTLCEATLRDERIVEGAVKFSFLRVHRRLERYRFDQPFAAWMCGIAREVSSDALSNSPGDSSDDWIGLRIIRESGRRLGIRQTALTPQRAFASLEIDNRRLLALQCVEGLSDEDIAGALAVDTNQLKTRLAFARARFAERIDAPEAPGPKEQLDRGRLKDALSPHELAAVRAALGEPDRARIVRAIDEIERQVALEDIIDMMVRSVVQSTQEFVEVLGHIYPDGAGPGPFGRS